MKHGSLISPDEAPFGFGTPKAVTETTSATSGDAADFITVPDAHLLFSGEFKHLGNDLKIVGEDGKSFLVTDYFKTDKHPTLRSPEGATLSGDLVDLLAGPLAPGQYAQAGAPQPGTAEVVGRVAVVTGNVTVIRNGVAITVNAGDAILKNDVVQTGAGATLALAFNDGSTFNLTANARLAINEFVYDPNGTANSSLVTLIQGAATFVAGQVAKTGDMKVATPVATMGIRGTAVMLDINALDGRVSITVIDQRDGKEHVGEVFDRAGNLIARVTSVGGRLFLTPTTTNDVIASFTNKTPEQVALEFAAFQSVLSSYEAAKQWFPNLPDHTDLNPKGTNHAGGSDIQPSDKTAGLPDSVTQGQNLPEIVFTKTAEAPGADVGKGPGETPTPITLILPPPPPLNPVSGSGTFSGTNGADYITGSQFADTIDALGGNDFVFGFGGNDTFIAGLGLGDDYYDGGAGDEDTIAFPSAEATQPLTFHLRGINNENTADGTIIGHDIFINIERIESGAGDDVFNLYADDDWFIDGKAGVDIIRFTAEFDIPEGEGGIEAHNVEIIDLNQDFANAVQFDGQGVFEINNQHIIRVLGGATDTVTLNNSFYLSNEPVNGYWELVSETPVLDPFEGDSYSDGIYFYEYQFVDGEEVLATAYLQQGVLYNAPPEIDWSPESATTPVNTPLQIDGMQFDDATAAPGELFTFTVKTLHGSITPAFDPADFGLIQVPITGDDHDANTPLPYQWSFTGTLANINAALEAGDGDTGFTYEPESNYNGPSALTFTVTDSHGASDSQILNISVNAPPVNEAPQIAVSAQAPTPLVEDGAVTAATKTVTVSDPDSDVHYVLNGNWMAVEPDLEDALEYNGHYYAFFAFDRGTVSWTDAQNSARAMGGDLATITSAGENGFVFTNLVDGHVTNNSTAAYVGGSDVGSTGSWHWSSGLEGIPYFWNGSSSSYGQYTNWRDGEPNFLGTEHVLVMEGDGTWNNASDAYGNAVGYVAEFANYRMDGTYGYAIFNTANGTITYHLDNEDPDTQALGATSHVTDDFEITVTDGNSTVNKTVSFAIDGTDDAPAPVLDLDGSTAGSGYVTSVTFGTAAGVLDIDATITGASSLNSATIVMTGQGNGGYVDYGNIQFFIDASQLEGATGTNFSGTWQGVAWQYQGGSSNLQLTLTGEGTAAEYLELLQAARMQFADNTANTGANVAITVNSDGGNSNTATTVVDIPNRAPDIRVFEFNTDSATIPETDAPPEVSGTLTLIDTDRDQVSLSVTGITADGTLGAHSADDFLGFLWVTPETTSGIYSSEQFTWTFDPDNETFDYLTDGESLILHYTIHANDGSATDDQVVTITINGTDETPPNEPPVANDDTLSGDLAGFTYNPDNGHWYKINSNEVSWAQARSEALAAGGYLATLTSLAENTFVSTLLTNYEAGYAYVGGTDQGAEGVWKWIDGPEAGQEFWQGGTFGAAPNGIFENWQHSEDYPTQYVEPNGGEIENYMYVRATGEWVDQPGESYPGLFSVIEVSFVEDTVSVIPGAFLLDNDTDADGPTPSIYSVSETEGTYGTVELVGNNIVYTPDANYNGPVSFEYTVSDGTDVSDPATASFSVEAINDAPSIQGPASESRDVEVPAGDEYGFLISNNFTFKDPDANDARSVSISFDAAASDGLPIDFDWHSVGSFSAELLNDADGNNPGLVHWLFEVNPGAQLSTFNALPDDATLAFNVQVSDQAGAAATHQIQVNVISGFL